MFQPAYVSTYQFKAAASPTQAKSTTQVRRLADSAAGTDLRRRRQLSQILFLIPVSSNPAHIRINFRCGVAKTGFAGAYRAAATAVPAIATATTPAARSGELRLLTRTHRTHVWKLLMKSGETGRNCMSPAALPSTKLSSLLSRHTSRSEERWPSCSITPLGIARLAAASGRVCLYALSCSRVESGHQPLPPST